jgi:hypothetical protein
MVSRVTYESRTLLYLGQLRKMSPATSTEALIDSDLPGLKLLSKGKVRDIYETSDPNRLLFVATDRISAYDVIMKNVREPRTHPCAGWVNELLRSGCPRQRANLDTDFDLVV